MHPADEHDLPLVCLRDNVAVGAGAQAVPQGAKTVVLDARGTQFSSPDFAEHLGRWEMQGVKQICYLIGGPEGHSQEVRRTADLLLSFSKMTFTHDMVRLLLVEQLYRAYTIKAGEKYHK